MLSEGAVGNRREIEFGWEEERQEKGGGRGGGERTARERRGKER
jgi:hypothetical protein